MFRKLPDEFIRGDALFPAAFTQLRAATEYPVIGIVTGQVPYHLALRADAGAPAAGVTEQWEWSWDSPQQIFIPPGYRLYGRRQGNSSRRGSIRIFKI